MWSIHQWNCQVRITLWTKKAELWLVRSTLYCISYCTMLTFLLTCLYIDLISLFRRRDVNGLEYWAPYKMIRIKQCPETDFAGELLGPLLSWQQQRPCYGNTLVNVLFVPRLHLPLLVCEQLSLVHWLTGKVTRKKSCSLTTKVTINAALWKYLTLNQMDCFIKSKSSI